MESERSSSWRTLCCPLGLVVVVLALPLILPTIGALARRDLVYVILGSQPFCYALANRNLEMVFIITDAETGDAIPDASVELWDWKDDPKHQEFSLVTSTDGIAKFFRENNSCEDVERLFRKTVTLFDLTWASVNVSAKGYHPAREMWLHNAKYENKGYFAQGHLHRLEFKIPLHQAGRRSEE